MLLDQVKRRSENQCPRSNERRKACGECPGFTHPEFEKAFEHAWEQGLSKRALYFERVQSHEMDFGIIFSSHGSTRTICGRQPLAKKCWAHGVDGKGPPP